ncbi:MAG: hypothetical protein DRJ28_04480 [Actinobacteria bacterium]|nr:MAG: hypothetical protein DRJ28_04480 [Actinomycetota bacterium]
MHRVSGRTNRSLVAFVIAVTTLVIPTTPADAHHGGTTVAVGVANNGDVGRNNYDDSDLTGSKGVPAGTQIDFSFVDGDHNVIWVSTNPATLPNSAGPSQENPTGTVFSVTMPTTPGMYIYYCGLRSDEEEALTETDFADDRPDGMYGRIEVVQDTTAPVWDTGSATATAISANRIDLIWPTATDDSGTVFFDVWQASGNTNPGKGAAVLITDNTTSTSLSATDLTTDVHYWYWITPLDAADNTGPDLTGDATPASPALSLTINASTLDMGTLSPASTGAGSTTVTVQTNETWSLTVKSTGRDGIDEAVGDDAFYEADNGARIPVGRTTWDIGTGPVTLTAEGDVALTAQPPTSSAAHTIDFELTLHFDDPSATNYQTTVLYTVTQP